MDLELIRTYYADGTNGELYFDGNKICDAIELPWKNNQHKISCIPEGVYRLTKRFSPRHQWHFAVNNVPDRSDILIHSFNCAIGQSLGCIAPVTKAVAPGKGIYSKAMMEKLKALLYPLMEQGNKIYLHINQKDNENISTKGAGTHTEIF